MFEVGDLVKGTERGNDVYMYSNEFMTKAEVVSINDDETMDIGILSHDYAFECIGDVLTVAKEDFDLYLEKKSMFVNGHKHEISYRTFASGLVISNPELHIKREYEKLVVLGLL